MGRRLMTLVGLCAVCAAATSGCRAPSAPAPVLCTFDQGAPIRGPVDTPRIALVFTGGEHGEGTGPILDALRAREIRAGFFVTGDYIARPGAPALLRRMVAEGHYLGPHSHSHPLYCAWEDRERTLVTRAFFEQDLRQNLAELAPFGAPPPDGPVYFIPPYEWFNVEQTRWAAALGMTLFNFTPGSGSNRDWAPEGHKSFVRSTQIVADILAFEQREPHGLNGFILLLHLGSQRQDKMHPHLPELLEALGRRGYAFVRIDALLADCR